MSDSPLKLSIQDAMKAAMRAKEKERLGVIRMILAGLKQREIDEQVSLDDSQVLAALDKMSKQRRESITQYKKAERADLVAVEEFELTVIQDFLPAQLTDAEIEQLIDEAVTTTGAASIKDMGKVMGIIKPKAQGKADMSAVSQKIKQRLA